MFIEPTGRKFDKNGDIVKEWWSKQSLIEFKRRSQCIEKQYSKFKVQGKYPVRRSIAFLLELTKCYSYVYLFVSASDQWESDTWREHCGQWWN